MSIIQTLTNSFKVELLEGIHDFTTDTFKIALYSSTASLGADTTVYSTNEEVINLTYTPGGNALVVAGPDLSGATAYVSFNDVIWENATFTAAGALIYNSSKDDKSVAVLNFGNNKTVNNGAFTVQFPPNTVSTALIRIG